MDDYKKLRDELLTGVDVADEDALAEIKLCLRNVPLDPTRPRASHQGCADALR
jgi:hypothetical protein